MKMATLTNPAPGASTTFPEGAIVASITIHVINVPRTNVRGRSANQPPTTMKQVAFVGSKKALREAEKEIKEYLATDLGDDNPAEDIPTSPVKIGANMVSITNNEQLRKHQQRNARTKRKVGRSPSADINIRRSQM